jgi:hypothetical protein
MLAGVEKEGKGRRKLPLETEIRTFEICKGFLLPQGNLQYQFFQPGLVG